jgi:hypothetical protein
MVGRRYFQIPTPWCSHQFNTQRHTYRGSPNLRTLALKITWIFLHIKHKTMFVTNNLNSVSVQMGFMVDKVALVQVLLRAFRFPLTMFIPPNSTSSQSPGAVTIGQKWPMYRVDAVWTPTPTMRIKKKIKTLWIKLSYKIFIVNIL